MENQVLTFGVELSKPVLLAIAAGIPVLVFALYWFTVIKVKKADRIILAIIRTLIMYILFIAILQPVMRGKKDTDSFMAIMLDTSKSMTIDDCSGKVQRATVAKRLIKDGALVKEIKKVFKENLKFYTFSTDIKPVSEDLDNVSSEGEKTDLVRAINGVVEDNAARSLSSILCITDGVDNVNTVNALTQLGYSMREKNIPLYFCGLGSEVKLKDMVVAEVSGPDTIEDKLPLNLNVTFASQGYPSRTVPVKVYEDDKLIKTFDQPLQPDGTIVSKFTTTPAGTGFRKYKFEIPVEADEFVKDNNSSFITVNVTKKKERLRVLFVQGYVSEELKWVNRTLVVDKDINFVSLSRTGPGTWMAVNVEDEAERNALSNGFPKNKEAIYRYDGIVLANLTPDILDKQQIETMVDFAKTHGGGILLYGSEMFKPKWANSPLFEIYPVFLEKDESLFRSSAAKGDLKMVLTPEGMSHEIFTYDGDYKKDKEKWEALPALTSFGPVEKGKSGAMILSTHKSEKNMYGNYIVMAAQNYGSGKVVAITVDKMGSWRLKVDAADKSYEKFWRQLVRWLTTERLEKVSIKIDRTFYAIKETVKIDAAIYERAMQNKDTYVEANIVDPAGKLLRVKLVPSLEGNWTYEGKFIADIKGGYRVKIVAKHPSKNMESKEIYFDVRDTSLEFSNVTLNESGLRQLTSTSNGKYYKPGDIVGVIEKDLKKVVVKIQMDTDLWDSPWVLIAIILLFTAEWIIRKSKGLI
ncbi:MAG: hypothetical protein A2231_05910 [Candidatus Firestonebacteria bacterium RIFOXYA2_FULL_40_8]|nr:MAG: hypothetical protein A2231_05910 [Candidatus Firestonebacteria bacterium RIFOXYA2_FULL_40_8]